MAEIFSTVMRGYKKEEVTKYIADLSEQMQQLKSDLDAKEVLVDRLRREIAEAEAASAQPDEEQMEALRTEVREQVMAELEADFETRLATAKAELEAELVAVRAELEESVVKDSATEELERKAREYDECKDALADLMIQARRNADDIVAKAEGKAQMLIAKSEMEFSRLRTDFALLQQTVGNLRGEMQVCLDRAADHVAAFEQKIVDLQAEVEKTIGGHSDDTEI